MYTRGGAGVDAPLEYISHIVMPYDQASVFSSYFGFLLFNVSSVSGASHLIGAADCHSTGQTFIIIIIYLIRRSSKELSLKIHTIQC